MPPKIDLRRYNITDQTTMIEFLELVVNKVPQMIRLMKKLQLENQSLRNKNTNLQENNDKLNSVVTPPELVDGNVSVSDRLAGKTYARANQVSESERIAQMQKAAVGMGFQAPAAPDPNATVDDLPEITTDDTLLPKPPSAPGQIGNLNLPTPNPTSARTPLPAAPPVPPAVPGQEPPAEIVDDDPADEVATDDIDLGDLSEEVADDAAGSKSESSTDEPIQSTVTPPSDADKTPVGTRVARGQKKNKRR